MFPLLQFFVLSVCFPSLFLVYVSCFSFLFYFVVLCYFLPCVFSGLCDSLPCPDVFHLFISPHVTCPSLVSLITLCICLLFASAVGTSSFVLLLLSRSLCLCQLCTMFLVFPSVPGVFPVLLCFWIFPMPSVFVFFFPVFGQSSAYMFVSSRCVLC